MSLAHESEAPLLPLELKAKREVQLSDESGFKAEAAESPNIRRLGKHHSTNKSVAGGGVIIGGLVTATFAVVYCYIRVTRKKDSGDCDGGGGH